MEEQELATERGAQHILTKKGLDKNQDVRGKKEGSGIDRKRGDNGWR